MVEVKFHQNPARIVAWEGRTRITHPVYYFPGKDLAYDIKRAQEKLQDKLNNK